MFSRNNDYIKYMQKDTLKIKNEIEEFGYGIIDYPEYLKDTIFEVAKNFEFFCCQTLEYKNMFLYKNSMGYENRDRSLDQNLADHKESFYIKLNYKLPDNLSNSEADKKFILSCKTLLNEMIPVVGNSTIFLSEIANTNLDQYFDGSSLTLRLIHYYPDSNNEIANQHVDRGGQTYHLYETTDGLQAYWNNRWSKIVFNNDQMIYFPSLQAQYITKSYLKGLCHRVVSNKDSVLCGRYSIVLFVEYNKLPYKYSMKNNGPIEKAFKSGQNYSMSFEELKNYFEEK